MKCLHCILQIWSTIMSLGEWNKKEELVTDQAVRHLKAYCPLLQAFASTDRSELALILKVQEFCYENMNFMKAFQKIILLFYKSKWQFFVLIYMKFILIKISIFFPFL